jgi:hypothetical protein
VHYAGSEGSFQATREREMIEVVVVVERSEVIS